MKANAHAVITQIGLQPLSPIRVPGSFMGRGNLDFKPGVLSCTRRLGASTPSVIATGSHPKHPTQHSDRIFLSHRFNPVVFHRDPFAK
ncbi:hypothetical protein AWB72_03870 [Caballeronia concitans]|uniref:Uncharacterized protein n=1 Tax=Caballeronia concitans TaxID=1777133 RepID=A0A658R0N7_9BURK|nr:hypothetical protein AWB72_03870 [Caballeronia concitans]